MARLLLLAALLAAGLGLMVAGAFTMRAGWRTVMTGWRASEAGPRRWAAITIVAVLAVPYAVLVGWVVIRAPEAVNRLLAR